MSNSLNFAPRKIRTVVIGGARTSIGLEPMMWEGLKDVARRENIYMTELLERIDMHRRTSGATGDDGQAAPLTPAIRVFLLAYFRALAERGPTARPLKTLLARTSPAAERGDGSPHAGSNESGMQPPPKAAETGP